MPEVVSYRALFNLRILVTRVGMMIELTRFTLSWHNVLCHEREALVGLRGYGKSSVCIGVLTRHLISSPISCSLMVLGQRRMSSNRIHIRVSNYAFLSCQLSDIVFRNYAEFRSVRAPSPIIGTSSLLVSVEISGHKPIPFQKK